MLIDDLLLFGKRFFVSRAGSFFLNTASAYRTGAWEEMFCVVAMPVL